ncbi:AraC family ligand binding domain-containing protein, partial [Klebsiella pneumoniae]|nr:AraC family ligand binding domain-containing protein [Klebsiella pneumoniae]
VDECGKENLYVGNGYEYEVTKPAVLHIVTQGTGTFTVNDTTYHLKKADGMCAAEADPHIMPRCFSCRMIFDMHAFEQ